MTKPTLFPKPFRLNRDWMDRTEQTKFRQMRETEQISFFRTKACAGPKCDNEVPKVDEKLYCSPKCREAALEEKAKDTAKIMTSNREK